MIADRMTGGQLVQFIIYGVLVGGGVGALSRSVGRSAARRRRLRTADGIAA